MEENHTNVNQQSVSSLSIFQRMGRIVWRLFLFSLVVFVILGIGVAFWLRKINAPINIETVNSSQLTQWFLFRDLNKETPEISEELAEQYVQLIEDQLNNSNDIPLINTIKGNIRQYLENKETRSSGAIDSNQHYALDYVVMPRDDSLQYSSRYILPEDIAPTPDLIQKLKSSNDSNLQNKPFLKVEANSHFILKNWFLKKMRLFQETPDEQKLDFLHKTTIELHKFQQFYNKLLQQLDCPEVGQLTLLKEFDSLTSSWFTDAALVDNPSELAKLLWFKDLLVSTIVIEEANLPSQWILKEASYSSPKSTQTSLLFTKWKLKNSSASNPSDISDKPADNPMSENRQNLEETEKIDFF